MPAPVSDAVWLERFKAKHEDRYNYLEITKTSPRMVRYLCPEHGEQLQNAHQHVASCGCVLCGRANQGKRPDPWESVLSRCRQTHGDKYQYRGYTQIAAKFEVLCETHGWFSQEVFNHLKGHGCQKCAGKIRGDVARQTSKQIATRGQETHSSRYTYLEDSILGTRPKMQITCPDHGIFEQSAGKHLAGQGCPKCSAEGRGSDLRLTKDEFVRAANKVHRNKYQYGEFTKTAADCEIICTEHGLFTQWANNHLKGSGCPKCSSKVSSAQLEITSFINKLGFETQDDFIYDIKTSKREVDILVPSKNLAIEYNGVWWHCSKYKEIRDHQQKQLELEALGIRCIQIFSDEWQTRRLQVKSLLRQALGVQEDKVYARKTKIVKVSLSDAIAFHDKHHIQGSTHGIHWGLEYEGQLVMVMTFKVKDGGWDLARLCSSVQVVGGASKLFKHFVKEVQATCVVSFSDIRLFSGKVYETLGFVKDAVLPPSYTYTSSGTNRREHKFNFRHKNLASKFPDTYDPNLSEKENTEKAGYYRVYDCGLIRWRWEA